MNSNGDAFEPGQIYELNNLHRRLLRLKTIFQSSENGILTFNLMDDSEYGEGGDEIRLFYYSVVGTFDETRDNGNVWFITRNEELNNSNNLNNSYNSNNSNESIRTLSPKAKRGGKSRKARKNRKTRRVKRR